jgi:DNA-binding Xre family transcriptional regulator
MAKKESKTYKLGKNAKTGQLTTVREARNKPSTHVVERVVSRSGSAMTVRGNDPMPPRRKVNMTKLPEGLPSPQIIETPGGERLAVMPFTEYERLVSAAVSAAFEDSDDAVLYDEAKRQLDSGEDELVPESIADRLIEGECPIKVWREYRNMSGRELAEKATLSAAYVSQLESGERKGSIQTLKKLAGALGVSVDDLS